MDLTPFNAAHIKFQAICALQYGSYVVSVSLLIVPCNSDNKLKRILVPIGCENDSQDTSIGPKLKHSHRRCQCRLDISSFIGALSGADY